MKKLIKITAIIIAAMMLICFAACKKTNYTGDVSTAAPIADDPAETVDDPQNDGRETTGEFSITPVDGGSVSNTGSVYTVTTAGEYTVSGRLADGQIIIQAGSGDEVKLVLKDASISCSTGAPILALSADKVSVKAEEGTYNAVHDDRGSVGDSEEYDAAIWADCDLKLVGKGVLIVTSSSTNGVKTKDDLSVKNVTLKVTSQNVALKGNDSVTIESGEMILISESGDGLKTSNSDVSSKGNQKGTILISGGRVDVYAASDGISAAYNAEFSGDCIVNVYTSTYASNAASGEANSEIYLAVPAASYSDGYDYYLYFYNDDDIEGVWVKAEYETKIYSGRSASHYGLKAAVPAGYQNMLVNIVNKGTTPDGSNYTAASGGETVNTAMNCYVITGISSGVISGDWVNLSSGSGSNKTTYSSKGIKAGNDIAIGGGSISVMAMDDALHANSGEKLDNGSNSTGNVTVSGGTLVIKCADDAIHADGTVTISGGSINIAESHEGIEGNVIDISDGIIYVYAKDDGMNAGKGASSPLINITGGYVDITTPSGDTDAIDANGNFTMSGGYVIVKCGAQMGGMAGSVDVDGTITVTGGTIIALGGICETPANGSVCTYISGGTSFAAGSYKLTDNSGNTIAEFTLTSSYNSCWIASDKLERNGSYVISRDGSELVSWTQSSDTVGSAGNGGMGGMGGRR